MAKVVLFTAFGPYGSGGGVNPSSMVAERFDGREIIHLPYLPEQVADVLRATRQGRKLEIYQRADLASMSLETMVRAVELAVEVGLKMGAGTLK